MLSTILPPLIYALWLWALLAGVFVLAWCT